MGALTPDSDVSALICLSQILVECLEADPLLTYSDTSAVRCYAHSKDGEWLAFATVSG